MDLVLRDTGLWSFSRCHPTPCSPSGTPWISTGWPKVPVQNPAGGGDLQGIHAYQQRDIKPRSILAFRLRIQELSKKSGYTTWPKAGHCQATALCPCNIRQTYAQLPCMQSLHELVLCQRKAVEHQTPATVVVHFFRTHTLCFLFGNTPLRESPHVAGARSNHAGQMLSASDPTPRLGRTDNLADPTPRT